MHFNKTQKGSTSLCASFFVDKPSKVIFDMNDRIDDGSDQRWSEKKNQNDKRVCNRLFFRLFSQQEMKPRAKYTAKGVIDDVNIRKSANGVQYLKKFEYRAEEKTKQHRFDVCMFV